MVVAMAHWLDKVVERYDEMEQVKPSVITVSARTILKKRIAKFARESRVRIFFLLC